MIKAASQDKVKAFSWSSKDYQMMTEELWRRNTPERKNLKEEQEN
jgi:hypothetical protein